MQWLKNQILLIFFAINMPLAVAQGIPPVYSQFYMNPFVYNPAYAGSDGHASLYLVHRRQYIGIEGAPVTSTLSLHTPIAKKAATGFMVSHDQAGIFKNISFNGSFAYILPLGKEHNFRMGLSAGVVSNTFDLTGASQEQLAYLANRTATDNNFQAKFGINYQIKNFNIGLSSNNITRSPAIRGFSDNRKSIAPFHDLVFNTIYSFDLVPRKIHLEPYLIYQKYEQESRTEAGLLFYYQKLLWTGASYRGNYGVTGYFGLNLNDIIKLAYAYELGNQAISGFTNSTHELQIAIKLGKEKKYSKEILRKPRFEM